MSSSAPAHHRLPSAAWFVALICVAYAVGLLITECTTHLGAPATGDFKRIWASAGVLSMGGNPFDVLLVDEYAHSHGAGATERLPFYYPPVAFSVVLPLALLPYETARLSYLGGVALLFIGMWIIPAARSFLHSATAQSLLRLLCYVSFAPALHIFWVGAFSIVPLVALLAIVHLLSREPSSQHRISRDLELGALAALTLVKPNICPLVFPYLGTVWLTQSNKIALGGFALGLAALAVPLVVFGFSLESAATATNFASSLDWQTPALSRHIEALFGFGHWFRWAVVLAGMTVAVRLGLRSGQDKEQADTLALLILPLGVLVTPFIWTYDFAVLAASLTFIVDRSLARSVYDAKALRAPLVALLSNVLLCLAPLAMALHWFYPIGIAVAALMTRAAVTKREAQ